MKLLKTTLVAIALLMGTITMTATETLNVDPTTSTETISKEISKLLQNPSFTFNESIEASVTFVVNKHNEIVVLSVDSNNDAVSSFIKSRLNYEKLEVSVDEGTEYIVPVEMILLD